MTREEIDGKTYWWADEENQIATDGKRSWSVEVPQLKEELSRRMSMVEDLEDIVESLEAWKEQRLKKADPQIEHLVRLLGKKVEELETWKAKARPFLIVMQAQVLKSIEDGCPDTL